MIYEKPELELITNDPTLPSVYRMKVPAGWVVISIGNICYVPDPGHAWQWTREKSEKREREVNGEEPKCIIAGSHSDKICTNRMGSLCDDCPAYKPPLSGFEEMIANFMPGGKDD